MTVSFLGPVARPGVGSSANSRECELLARVVDVLGAPLGHQLATEADVTVEVVGLNGQIPPRGGNRLELLAVDEDQVTG